VTEHSHEFSPAELAGCRIQRIGKPARILSIAALAGIVLAGVNCWFVTDGTRRFMAAYLIAFAFVLSISLGALFFVLIQHLMRAGWSVVVRRMAEFFALNVVVVALLFLPIAWTVWQGNGLIYSWSKTDSADSHTQVESTPAGVPQLQPVALLHPGLAGGDDSQDGGIHEPAHAVTKPYLTNARFLITWTLLFVFWIVVAGFYYRSSVAQDSSGDVNLTRRMEWWSGIATLLFGFSLTIAAVDLLMALDSAWYSTMFGVYYFAGCAVSGIATLLLFVLLLKRLELVPEVFSDEVQRDLGRLLFAFVFFWAYIAFSQYMLLWYANMPETTTWLVRRGMSTATGYTNSWGWLAVFLLLAHFAIPFAGIMSRHVKSGSGAMIFWTVWMLVVHYLDLYWIVMPEYNSGLTVSFVEIGTLVTVVSVYGLAVLWIASRSCLFAVGDPRLHESQTRQAMY